MNHETETDKGLLPLDRLRESLEGWSDEYQANHPFPHLCIEGFLEDEPAQKVAGEFPSPDDTSWTQYKHYNENKLGKQDREQFPSLIGSVIDELNSDAFVDWLSELTGIEGLMSDPSLNGGGMHQTEKGGFLNIHADFTMHHHQHKWRRRCNLILFLNENWEMDWGGALEFWNREMTECGAKYPPMLNHAVIFNTDETSHHGYPDPISCPQGVTRKSLALYYYTLAENAAAPQATNYVARPGDGWKALPIWIDKKLVSIYSLVKTKFGLSDDFASRVLGMISRKKK